MISDAPAVSVIVPCYRVTAFIAETLESLRAQTFRNFETIVVASNDAGDNTELERALAPYRDEVVFIKQKKHGLGDARNAGILAARAPLLALLDGDDRWKRNYLEVQTGYLEQHPNVDVVYPNAVMFGETTWTGRIFRDVFPSRGEVTLRSLLRGECRVTISVTARRQALLDVGMFDGELRWAEDYDLWLRMAKAGHKIAYHDQVLLEYRLRRGALSSDKLNSPRAAVTVLNKLLQRGDLSAEEREAALNALRDYQATIDLILGRTALYRKDGQGAIFHLRKANETLKNRRVQAAILSLRVAPWLLYRLVRYHHKTEYDFLH